MNTNIYYPNLIPNDQNKYRLNLVIYDLLNEVNNITKCCKNGSYTLVLHKHLGDVFYAIGAKDAFYEKYGEELNFVVRPQQEFLMKLWGVSKQNYIVYDIDRLVKKNVKLKKYFFGEKKLSSMDYEWLENMTFQAVFSCLPNKSHPFICDNQISNIFTYPRYWCYRWAGNMGIDESFRFSIPNGHLPLTKNAIDFCKRYGGVEKIVLIAPEAQTATELPFDFWEIIVKEIQKLGYCVVVNSNKYNFKKTISAFEEKLSLEDVVSISLKCAYVFTLRSGLSDVLVSAGDRLYAINPSILRREDSSLNKPFISETHCNEIQLFNWEISSLRWNGIDLGLKLQKVIDQYHRKYKTIKFFNKIPHNRKLTERKDLIENIFGRGGFFPETNIENRPPTSPHVVKIFNFCIYKKKFFIKHDHNCNSKTYFEGLVTRVSEYDTFKINFMGIRVFSRKKNEKKIVKILGIPVYIKNRREEFLRNLQKTIKPGYDNIFIIRHNIGETFLYLSYFSAWAKKNHSKKPLVVVWRPKDIYLYRMFLNDDMYQFIELSQNDLNTFFKTPISNLGDMTLFTPTYHIAENMKLLYKKGKDVNFNDYIKDSMGLGSHDNITNTPNYSQELAKLVTNQLLYWGINEKRFVLLCPEATSLRELPYEIWNKIITKAHSKGLSVIVNTSKEHANKFNQADQVCFMPLDELYVLAHYSCAIVSMASGLGVFLSSVGVSMLLLYTRFKSLEIDYDADLSMKIYSVKNLDFINTSKVTEINCDSITNEFFEIEINKLFV